MQYNLKVSEFLVGGVRDLKSRTERHLTELIAQFSIRTAARERSQHVTKPLSGETLFPIREKNIFGEIFKKGKKGSSYSKLSKITQIFKTFNVPKTTTWRIPNLPEPFTANSIPLPRPHIRVRSKLNWIQNLPVEEAISQSFSFLA